MTDINKKSPFEPIETARLRLRCVTPKDASATSAMITPEVSQWVARWPVPFTYEMAVSRINLAREEAFRGNALPFAILDKVSDELLGWVMINRDRDDRRRASFGYWLGVAHHGKGYMSEVASTALRAGFDLLELDVIEAAVQPGNAASLAIMKSCGMTTVGQRKVYAPARQREEICDFFEICNSNGR